MDETVSELRSRLEGFESAARAMLSMHEGGKARVFSIGESRRKLQGLTLAQEDLLEQSLRCIEYGLFRPSLVVAWAAFIDFLLAKLFDDSFVKLHGRYPNWTSYRTIEDLRENVNEYQLLEAAERLGLFGKPDGKTLKGLLSQRNQAAHAGSTNPNINISLGYVSKLLQMIEQIAPRTL